MAIYNIGSTYYLGDVQFGTFNVNYPAISYLEAFPHNAISAEISALCTAAGLPFRNVLPQANFNSYATMQTLLAFGSNGDINDRYYFGLRSWDFTTPIGGEPASIRVFNDSGYVPTDNTHASSNGLVVLLNRETSIGGLGFTLSGTTNSLIQWFGCANNTALALGCSQHNFTTNVATTNFWYAGLLSGVTTSFNYYSASNITKSIAISGQWINNNTDYQKVFARHYIANASKKILQTGFAEYSLSGSTSQWSGDFLVYDDNTTLGFPTIGEASLLRVLEGTYTIGKPAQLTGDVPNRLWLPVGKWTTNRTLAVEVYSS